MKKHAISAGNPATLEAAQEVLLAGGNAVDAAIAAYLTSFVAEPCMASIGAGGFAIVHHEGESKLLDFFCQTPTTKLSADKLDFYPVTIDFGTATEDFHIGQGAAATPGALAGIYLMHKLYATMPMQELASHAIAQAKEGALVDSFQAYDIKLLNDIFSISKKGQEIFFTKDGERLQEGEKIFMPQFADFMDVLSIEGPDLFYKGEIAQKLDEEFRNNGGNLRYKDFADYKAEVRKPLTFDWGRYHIHTTPAPSAGGSIIAAFLMTFLKEAQQTPSLLSQEHYQKLKTVFEKINAIKDDSKLLTEYLYIEFDIKSTQLNTQHKWSGTSHFNIVDRNGMAVALTTSIGEGCGYFIPGTDMQLNNMLGESALLPKGFHSWTPDTRLRSMMTPTMVFDDDHNLRLVTGSGGAGRIPFAIAQVIINHIVYKLPIESAVQQPRLHIHKDSINIEKGFSLGDNFKGKVWDEQSLFFGGVHSIAVEKQNYSATGDQRRMGVAGLR